MSGIAIAQRDHRFSLDERRREVLFAVIAEYVISGRPVSSEVLSLKHELSLSPATIRRHLHQLTMDGFLMQPHTSAGRVPTDQAFRLFVDALKHETDCAGIDRQETLARSLQTLMSDTPGSWKEIVQLLSELSFQAALIITPGFADSVLLQLSFVPCSSGMLLAVVVTREGLVHNTFINPPDPMTSRDLEKVHNYLEELIEGRTLNEVRHLLRDDLEDARKRCDSLREKASLLGVRALQSSVEQSSSLVVEGRSKLLAQPELRDRIEELLKFLEEKSRILDLLDLAAETDRGPLVIIGEEGGKNFSGCAIVTSPFGKGRAGGQVGIIGSNRMDYSKIIPMVTLSAQALSFFFGNRDG